MRMLSGRWRDSKSATNRRTEESELRSRCMTMISASGNSERIRDFVSSAVLTLRAGSISLAPRLARTRAVSAPIPDVAPVMMAVRDRRSELRVTWSAVDLEPKPLGPPEPIRCLAVSIIILYLSRFLFLFLCLCFCYGEQLNILSVWVSLLWVSIYSATCWRNIATVWDMRRKGDNTLLCCIFGI